MFSICVSLLSDCYKTRFSFWNLHFSKICCAKKSKVWELNNFKRKHVGRTICSIFVYPKINSTLKFWILNNRIFVRKSFRKKELLQFQIAKYHVIFHPPISCMQPLIQNEKLIFHFDNSPHCPSSMFSSSSP